MTEFEKEREKILTFLQAWDADQPAIKGYPEQEYDDADPVLRALSYFPPVTLQ